MEHTVHTEQASSEPVWLRKRFEALTRGTSKGMSEMGVPGHSGKWGVATRPSPAVRPKDSRWSNHTWRPGKIPTLPQCHMVMDNYKFRDTVTNSTYISAAPDHEQCLSHQPRQLARLSQAMWQTSNKQYVLDASKVSPESGVQTKWGRNILLQRSNHLNLISAGVLYFFFNQHWIIVNGIYNIFNFSFSC